MSNEERGAVVLTLMKEMASVPMPSRNGRSRCWDMTDGDRVLAKPTVGGRNLGVSTSNILERGGPHALKHSEVLG